MSKIDPSTPRAGRGRRLAAVISVLAAGLAVVLPGSPSPVVALGPPDAPVYFSTAGNTNPDGVSGTADDADIYLWNGTVFSRLFDVSAAPYNLPATGGGNANVDGFSRVDATHFYVSFSGNVTVPVVGAVQDEDVVFYNAGTWSVYFDGTPGTRGLSGSDLDAISVVGGILYFSTDNTTVPVGVTGGGDDADIYSWNGTSFARVYDASALGWSSANVDGFVRVDATHFYVSYSSDTTVPVLGAVQDEDVVYYNAGVWSVYFDGTAHGLTSADEDVDAFAVPVPTVAQTITFGALAGKTFGDADFNVAATSSSGLPVSFSAVGSCTVVGTLVHLTGAGSCTITAAQPGDLITYLPATAVPQTFAIALGSQTITFGPLADKNIFSSDFGLNSTASSGLAVSYTASGECTVVGANVHLTGIAGSCTITATQPGDANYNPATDVAQTFNVIFVVPTANLYAVSGSTTLAGQPVTVWGYNTTNSPAGQPGGPTITVNQGDQVILVLRNQLTEPTSLVVRGQNLPTDRTGVLPGGFRGYSFTATQPGTFIYEAGPIANAQHQVAMGLYGTLIVNPTSGTAYNSTNEAVVLVSEIDPALNNSPSPATFDMRTFAPKYTLINGTVYSGSANLGTAAPGDKLLLRYVNAGINYHSMSVLGANQRIVGDDGHALAQPYSVVAQTVGPGQTFDAIVGVSATAAPGTKLTVFDANLQLRNRNRRPATATATVSYGGALAFVTIGGTVSTTDTVGPVSSNLAATSTTLSATISDATTGGSNVDAAEYFIDASGAAGTGTAMSGAFGSPTVTATATIALSAGNHTVYVRGHDAAGNWGPLVSVLYTNDNQGPASTGLNLTPNPTNGSVDVALHATGSDAAAGGSNVVAAEYTVNGGAAAPMIVNFEAVTASLDATIPAATVNALVEGSYPVTVRAQDAAGNWGLTTTINLIVDKSGPAMSALAVGPNPNNGTLGINSSTPAVRVTASAADVTSTIDRAEGFIDTVGANGTGFLFVPTDGTFNATTETISVDIPLLTIISLSAGPHNIYVHAKDAAGNWGPTSIVVLNIDKTPPTAVTITRDGLSPATAASVSFTVTFSEAVTGVTAANFTLVQGGGLFNAAVASVTGSGATRTVTVSTGSGGGTLGLNLSSATGITDIANNAMLSTGLPLVGQVYTLTTPSLYLSTSGSTNPQGVGGTADDADIYLWNGSVFSRSIDASTITNPLPGTANVDGFDRVDGNHFYMSFNGTTTIALPGPDLTVQDEDVVFYNAGTWSVYFDGTPGTRGLSGSDLDAISVVGGILYFSTDNTTVPVGVTGGGDDADIYSWNGTSFARVYDASALGWSSANVDGFVRVDATHFYVSYSSDTTVPVLGAVQDEDVVYYNAGVWSVYFDGTGKLMTDGNLDVDAFDIS